MSLAQGNNTPTRSRIEPGSPDPESDALTTRLRDLSYQDRLKHLKLPSLAHRRRRGDIIQCFKIIKGLDDIPCERFFTFAESRTRGHCYKLIKPRCETSFRLRSFSQRVITDWNSLPYDITAQTLNSFKNRVDKFWSGKDMYSF